jgi:hypothetical protein
MDSNAKQFTCECGKHFSNRNELDQHRKSCATAQAGGSSRGASGSGQQTRGAGGSHGTGS